MNILLQIDKWNHLVQKKPKFEILNKKTMKTIYFHVMLENLSVFYYKCEDFIYVLECLLC